MAEALSAAMRSRRKAAGLSQVEVAERAEMDPKHYQALESGFTSYRDRKPANPNLDTLRRIALAYGTTVPDLMHEVFGPGVEYAPQE